jgi:hypothetical protein
MNRRRFLKEGLVCAGVIGTYPLATWNRGISAATSQGGGSITHALDLSQAVVVAPATLSARERKAVQVLVEEVEKRTAFRWRIVGHLTPEQPSAVVVGSKEALRLIGSDLGLSPASGPATAPEGYRLRTAHRSNGTVILVEGADDRGVLFGVGGLLRALRLSKNRVLLPAPLEVATAPKYPLRGHELCYRPKTNAYDAWSVPMWDQYIRDLAVFGNNAIELVPPRSDDAPESPHFPLPPMKMMIEQSRIADEYGLDVWIWYPAMDEDYSDSKTVAFALQEWGEVFKALPRIDAVYVPAGDPGHTRPKYLLALIEKQADNLRRYHPRAQMWTSIQSFNEAWVNEFFDIVQRDEPHWLAGVVYAPQTRLELPRLRQRLPERYPLRLCPDITHSLQCQLPVPDWDAAYALTEGREVINPRPLGEANIFRLQAPHSIGFITYAEGCNDDVNKIVWSALGWNPEMPVIDILREYSAYLVSDRLAEDFAQGLLSLEENWKGPLLTNQTVYTTLEQFQSMENDATPAELLNWRFQMGMYRAYYDAYTRSRLINESSAQNRALSRLAEIRRLGVRPNQLEVESPEGAATSGLDPVVLLNQAEAELDAPLQNPVSQDWRTRLLELGEALYQSIHMQLAVERYQAEAVERAANLDTLDTALSDAPWLKEQFAEIRRLPSHLEQVRALEALLDRTNPGPGGFYDDLGNLTCQPHLVRGLGASRDPEFRASSLVGFGYPSWCTVVAPMAWKRWAESLFDAPLELYYPQVDPKARYRVRVTYSGETPEMKIRLEAGAHSEVHPFLNKPDPIRSLEFDIPAEATRGGDLTLRWFREPGLGGNGRGCQVAEVWILKKT